jgi:hypothetical protein
MPVGNFIFDNGWVLFILITVFNSFYLKARSQKIIAEKPDLQEGYDQLFKVYLTYLNIPWVVMGIGVLFGGVPGVFGFFNPRDGNIFVLAFHATVVILWILSIWWIYFKGGAEFLVKYPGVFNQDIKSPILLKVLFAVMLIGGIFGMAFMWSM